MSADRDLGERLRELQVPDEAGAEERSWALVRAAYEDRDPIPAAPVRRRLALALAGCAALLAIGLSPAGAKVGDLVGDVIGIGEEDAKPALRSLPAAGELLVESEQGPWIVREDGSKRLLGDYEQATWSPHGLYVAVADGHQLAAVDTEGNVHWTYPAPGVVRDPRWAGDAADTRIAYQSGDDLRVIAGDGDPASDHLIARNVASGAFAWRPIGYSKLGPPAANGFVLIYVDGAGKLQSVNVDTSVRVPNRRTDRLRLPVPVVGGGEDRALSPDGSRVARLTHVGARDRLIVTARGGGGSVLFSARGRLTGPTWSPDGRWLLVGWPEADQWVFIQTARPGRVVAFDRISVQFDPGGDGDGRFPAVAGWVLPER
jgi:WD40-like Beta Propeller Repeat